jgi:hypothetical protein
MGVFNVRAVARVPVHVAATQAVPVELLTTRFLRSWYAHRVAGTAQYSSASS